MDHHATLRIDRCRLAEVVHAVEILGACRMRRWRAAELFLEREPDRHRINPDRLPRKARHEQLSPVRLLDQGTESVRDFEPPLLINFGGAIAPKHVYLLHFAPQKSTAIVGLGLHSVNGKM